MKWFALALLVVNLCFSLGLSRFPGSNTASSVAAGSLPRVEGLKAKARSCVTVGWFETIAAAEALAGEGRPLEDENHQIASEKREMPPLHWVIIPPQSEQLAQAQLKKLQQQGVESYLVTEGKNQNAISLGLFESREAAVSVLEEKKRQNLNAVLANFPRNQISYALSFEVSSELVEKRVREVETEYGKKFDLIEVSTCKGIATPDKTP